jgi:hypothetical protein
MRRFNAGVAPRRRRRPRARPIHGPGRGTRHGAGESPDGLIPLRGIPVACPPVPCESQPAHPTERSSKEQRGCCARLASWGRGTGSCAGRTWRCGPSCKSFARNSRRWSPDPSTLSSAADSTVAASGSDRSHAPGPRRDTVRLRPSREAGDDPLASAGPLTYALRHGIHMDLIDMARERGTEYPGVGPARAGPLARGADR